MFIFWKYVYYLEGAAVGDRVLGGRERDPPPQSCPFCLSRSSLVMADRDRVVVPRTFQTVSDFTDTESARVGVQGVWVSRETMSDSSLYR